MQHLRDLFDFILHIDKHLAEFIRDYGTWTYLILFAIVFAETGLVIMPFLPGDSLLFAAGALAGGGSMNVGLLFLIFTAAAIIGDTVNYHVGHYLGPKAMNSRWIKREHLERTHRYFEKYGGSTIILARFVPIVRTFAPFVAGVGAMTYWKFLTYNVIGAIIWVGLLLFAGYWIGQLKWVQDNFVVVELAIIFISILPMLVEYLRFRRDQRREKQQQQSPPQPPATP